MLPKPTILISSKEKPVSGVSAFWWLNVDSEPPAGPFCPEKEQQHFWLSAKSLHIRIQKEHMAIALNLPYSLKICFTGIIHFRPSNCGVRKFNSLLFFLARISGIINTRKKQCYFRNLNWDKSDLQRLPSPLHWRYQGLCIIVWRKLLVLAHLNSTPCSPQVHLNSTIHLSTSIADKMCSVTPVSLGDNMSGCGSLLLQVTDGVTVIWNCPDVYK